MSRSARKRPSVRTRIGHAGLLATPATAIAGLVAGALLSYLGGLAAGVAAEMSHVQALDLRDAPLASETDPFAGRARIIESLIAGAPERFDAPPLTIAPRIIVIFDDMGPDRRAFDEIMALPGPVTLSFLPYARDIQQMADTAKARGDAVMLHLPMEPSGNADPGPKSLNTRMSAGAMLAALDWNLNRLEGYVGVNNHMGSRLTRDEAAMKTILSVLNERDLFFLDSLTTGKSVALQAGRAVGAEVYARDVFLDPQAGRDVVVRQLELVEQIARETGFAVAICHPRRDTLDMIGPWLTSAPSRGFELATVESLRDLGQDWQAARRIAAN